MAHVVNLWRSKAADLARFFEGWTSRESCRLWRCGCGTSVPPAKPLRHRLDFNSTRLASFGAVHIKDWKNAIEHRNFTLRKMHVIMLMTNVPRDSSSISMQDIILAGPPLLGLLSTTQSSLSSPLLFSIFSLSQILLVFHPPRPSPSSASTAFPPSINLGRLAEPKALPPLAQ